MQGDQVSWLTTTPDVIPEGLQNAYDIRLLTPDEDEARAILSLAGDINAAALIGDWVNSPAPLVAKLREAGLAVTLIGNMTGDADADLFVRQRLIARDEPRDALKLDGPSVLILPETFIDIPPRASKARADRVLISLGGSQSPLIDKIFERVGQLTDRAGLSLDTLRPNETGKPHTPDEVQERLCAADFAILAGGTSLHEAAACRLPTLCLPIVPRQLDRARQWETLGFGTSLVPETPHWEETFDREFHRFVMDGGFREHASQRMSQLVDGRGAIRVAREIKTHWPEPTLLSNPV